MMIRLDDPDAELMLRAGKGDRDAFENLVLKCQKSVLNTAYRYVGNPPVAEELAQDIFVRVFRAASTYKPEARFSTWLFTIVRNVCFNYRSREGKYDFQLDGEFDRDLPKTQREILKRCWSAVNEIVKSALRYFPCLKLCGCR